MQPEWLLLCSCAAPASGIAEIQALLASPLDWDFLLDLAEEHGVTGLFCAKLQQISFIGVPDPTKEKLLARIRNQHLFTLSMTAALFRILEKLSASHVSAILIKGPITSLLAYGDPAIRSYVDLDFLIRDREILSAVQHMRDLGFQCDLPESAVRAGKIPGEYLFRKPGQRIVELHTERTFRYYPKGMPIEVLLSRSRDVLLENRKVRALSLEDEFVLNCVHGAKHFWERLMWIADVAALVENHPEMDWEKVKRSAAETGASRMLRVAVQLASSLLRSQIPQPVRLEIRNDRAVTDLVRSIQAWLPYAGATPPPLFERAMFRLKMAGGGLAGTGYLVRLTLSPTQEDWNQGGEDRGPWLWDAVRRPFRLFRKYGSN